MKKFFIFLPLIALMACGSRDANKASAPSEESHAEGLEEAHEEEGMATLTEEQIASIGLKMGTIEQKQLTASLKTNGILKVPNQNKAIINSLYSGIVKSLLVQPGNFVKKGQTIATVANPEFLQTQSDYLGVKSKLILAELEVKRQKELNAGNAGALKNLQSAEADLRNLQTARSTLAQQIQLMGLNPESLSGGRLVSVLSIKSPISGVVSNVIVQMGSYVDASTTVAEVVDNNRLHLDLFVYEKDLPKLKNNQTIHFTITNNAGKEYDAKIFSLGSSFEGDSKAVTVHAMVEGDKTGLIDGMSVTAVVSLNQVTVPAVPDEAIVNVGGQNYIFVLSEGGHHQEDSAHHEKETGAEDKKTLSFERVAVARGASDVGYTEITLMKEIPKDARIVTKGAFFVSAKMTNTEGHAH
ncbi:MAG: efflux RND transporter periplasmic adaptor subunit [Gemmatimonadaceae bacterium]|nr:efflux RND transporter periplasmic adaptor subunit [Chitinophagaceae bacterium]